MKFLNIYYPTFKYESFKLTHLEVEKPPYGECFSCNFDESGNYLAVRFSNGYVNIFNLNSNSQKKFVDFQIGDYPITSLKFNKHVKSIYVEMLSISKVLLYLLELEVQINKFNYGILEV